MRAAELKFSGSEQLTTFEAIRAGAISPSGFDNYGNASLETLLLALQAVDRSRYLMLFPPHAMPARAQLPLAKRLHRRPLD